MATTIPYVCWYHTIVTVGAYSLVEEDGELLILLSNRVVYLPLNYEDGVEYMEKSNEPA